MFRSRREAITDAQIRTGGISLRSLQKIDHGTHALGGKAGTITFRHGVFVGTPLVILQPLGGFQRPAYPGTVPFALQVRSRYSGSFTYFGTPSGGTFQWVAIGSFAAR